VPISAFLMRSVGETLNRYTHFDLRGCIVSFSPFPPEPNVPQPQSEVFPAPEERPPKGRGCLSAFFRFVWEIVQTLLIAGLLYLGINAITARVRVQGMSMRPTFKSGEFVLVYRLAYRFSEPHRGDIVIFHPQAFPNAPRHAPEDDYIKRIIGLPGETVRVEGGRVYVNGRPLREPYIAEPPRYRGVWRVPPGEVFVLGDNRNNSTDSHVFGPVPMNRIVGRAVLVYWPPEAARIFHRPAYEAAGENAVK